MTKKTKVTYRCELRKWQLELVKWQSWIKNQGMRVVITFDGRDAAGKGGTIKRITERLPPRQVRMVALPKPSDREQSQWYFQRFVPHLPAMGEVVIFDRSWYNRATVERVMGYCREQQAKEFLKVAHSFERLLVDDGIILRKYWLAICREEQERRFQERARNPMKSWKLSTNDREMREKWHEFSKAKDEMIRITDYKEEEGRQDFMWRQCIANDKYRARLNVIRDILESMPGYKDVGENPLDPLEPVQIDRSELRSISKNYQHFIQDHYEYLELDVDHVAGEEIP